VTLEANACGLPVLAADHPLGIDKRLILEGKTGFFVRLSPENMAEKILLLLRDERLRTRMGADAVKFSQSYDWERIVDSIEKVYSSVRR
jgi:glycosyltransferase involved in cell wall biosynthesis